MGLAEILAAKRQNKPLPIEKADTSYISNDKYLPNYEINPLFLAVYTPLIRDPYSTFYHHFEYAVWLLSSENVHVLNTFPPISPDVLFHLYMKHNPPKCAHDLHRLYVAISRICLVVPPIYLPQIEEIIRKNS
jgi:hypothetical protein